MKGTMTVLRMCVCGLTLFVGELLCQDCVEVRRHVGIRDRRRADRADRPSVLGTETVT